MRIGILKQLSPTLWSAVVMELFERMAYYGMVLVLGIYMIEHLGIRSDTFGIVYGIFTGVLYFLPIFAGALADRYGYRPALIFAFATLTGGYTLLALTTRFSLLCLALGLIAVGGSIIKPTISGTVTRTTEDGSTRPVGFGLYYTMINAGALIGPVIAAQVRNRTEFSYVFIVSAAACVLMLLQATLLFREPVEATGAAPKSIRMILSEMVLVLANGRFVLLLVIFSGFWGMINVLFGFMPVYIAKFTDLRGVESAINGIVPMGHWLNPEVFISLDALLIVLFQALISYLTRRMPAVSAIFAGTSIATVSWIFPAISPAVGLVSLGILIWSLGEMTCSARFFEYCGTIAPPDQVGLYLGYSFLSIFLGNTYSGPWAGWLYRRFIEEPTAASEPTHPALFFGGVMLMGAISTLGMLLYIRRQGRARH